MKNIKNKRIKISLTINMLIAVATVIMLIIAYTGFKFMPGLDILVETKMQIFKYFTVQSNTAIGIMSLIFAIKEIQVLLGKKEKISTKYYILKMATTVAVALTFFVVFAYLGFITEGGIASLLLNSNLFFHLIIPVASISNFILFEKTDVIKFRYTAYGLVPTALYEIYYMVNILLNMEDGKVSPVYDWYYFLQNGIWSAIIVAPMMLGVTYIITLIIWKLNRIGKK